MFAPDLPFGFTLQRALPAHSHEIETLLDLTFGPGRFTRAAERVREQGQPVAALSLIVVDEHGVLRGTSGCTAVTVGDSPSLLLGPLAVHPDFKQRGLGRALLEATRLHASKLGFQEIFLVGDADYYARSGYVRIDPGTVLFDYPVDGDRILVQRFAPSHPVPAGRLVGARSPDI